MQATLAPNAGIYQSTHSHAIEHNNFVRQGLRAALASTIYPPFVSGLFKGDFNTEAIQRRSYFSNYIIATRLQAEQPRNRGSISDSVKRFLASRQRQDWFWAPTTLISNGYREIFHQGKAAGTFI
jgi:hypothetical protein